jgi:hypothetical protein
MGGPQNKKVIHNRSLPRAPTERVLSVEAVMDVARLVFRTGPCTGQPIDIDDVEAARAEDYLLLMEIETEALVPSACKGALED